MAADDLHKRVQDAARAIAPLKVDHLGKESRMFGYVDADSLDTVPAYAWDVIQTAHRAGYPTAQLREGVVELFRRVIAYRRACLAMSEHLLSRLTDGEGLPIEVQEFPSTSLGRGLECLYEGLETEDERIELRTIGDSLRHLQNAISDWEHDHVWGQRLAHAVFESLELPATSRANGSATGYKTPGAEEETSR
ncbi:MAG: hypothetical protein AAGF92_14670 [Myxococcota bacterium]